MLTAKPVFKAEASLSSGLGISLHDGSVSFLKLHTFLSKYETKGTHKKRQKYILGAGSPANKRSNAMADHVGTRTLNLHSRNVTPYH